MGRILITQIYELLFKVSHVLHIFETILIHPIQMHRYVSHMKNRIQYAIIDGGCETEEDKRIETNNTRRENDIEEGAPYQLVCMRAGSTQADNIAHLHEQR